MRRNRIKFRQCDIIFDITTRCASPCSTSAFRNSSRKRSDLPSVVDIT